MTLPYTVDEQFKAKDFALNPLPKGEYENCTFTNCGFTGSDLSSSTFLECEFENCDLSNVTLKGTSFRQMDFKNCKMLGLRFDQCDPFLLSFGFEDCLLNFSSFFRLKLKGMKVRNSKLEQVDFSETMLSRAIFKNCDFSGAIFSRTNLENADLETSFNFSIDPEANNIKKAKFSVQNIAGLLDKYKISIK